MELKEGYKQTGVGHIPEDWDLRNIGDITIKVGSGITPKGGSTIYKSYGRPFMRSQNVGWGNLKLLDVAYIDEVTHSKFDTTEIKSGDVLLNITGASIGRCAVADERIEGGNVNQHVCIIRVNDEIIDSDYCSKIILSSIGQKQISSFQAGGNREGLNFGQIRSMEIPLPPTKSEQTAIATALCDVDALIAQLEKLITKKRQIKQGAMQTLLNPFDGNGELKEGWTTQTVFDLAENKKELFDDGDWIEAEHITTQGIRLIQTGNIGVGRFLDKNTKKYIYESSFEKLKCKELAAGDLLICRLAEPAGRACIFPILEDQKVITSVDVTIFRPRSDIANRVFLVNLFSTPEWFNAVNESVGGTTHKRISRGALGKIVLQLPPVEEQNETASILSDMSSEILALEKKLEKTRKIKQGVMQSLLTGQIRLVDPTAKNEQ